MKTYVKVMDKSQISISSIYIRRILAKSSVSLYFKTKQKSENLYVLRGEDIIALDFKTKQKSENLFVLKGEDIIASVVFR